MGSNGEMRLCLLAFVPGCAFYAPSSFRDTFTPFPGMQLATSCLDVAVAIASDELTTNPIVEYSFGNRCARAVTVDLAHLSVVGKLSDGSTVHLTARDPNHELRPLALGGWTAGQERIEYEALSMGVLLSVCVDFANIEVEDPGAPHVVCVGGPT